MDIVPTESSSRNSSERKSKFLGMPFGTACNQLRRSILFHLLQRHGENTCFRCEQPIEAVSDLTIEHKRPWEGRDPDLFWDLENIAFSHRCCNLPHTDSGGRNARMIGPEGTAWCTPCQEFLPIKLFYRRKLRWNGLRSECKECTNKMVSLYRARKKAGVGKV